MSYQVLARKWRPRTFQELVGQAHVVRALVNALDQNRLHHAFLFTGTRGVGKTTLSRIFAKSLNCETGVTSQPCGQCGACQEIDQGRFVDLIEVDAASRTKVEDTRDLLENVQYAPTRGRYKVYLIDEVHMLSNHSFNALLKTLEEPPPHVKFLLATTDPQKLPVTVLSRCLQFSLKRLPESQIAEHLETILEREGIDREPAAVRLVARAGEGSMRDALSLLDQAIAFGGGRLTAAEVAAMLGALDQGHVLALVEALAAGDPAEVLNRVAILDESAPDYMTLLADLLSLLQRLAVTQAVPGAGDDGLFDPQELRRLAGLFDPEELQLVYQIALMGRRDLPLVPEPRGGFEMILLRMLAFRPGVATPGRATPGRATPGRATPAPGPDPEALPGATTESAPPAVAADNDWQTIVASLGLSAMARQLALHCVLEKREVGVIRLLLAPGHAQLRTRAVEERLQAALSDYYGESLRLKLRVGEGGMDTPAQRQAKDRAERQEAAAQAIHQDPTVKALCETFNAQVKSDSIAPID